jgi:hypothetical protein
MTTAETRYDITGGRWVGYNDTEVQCTAKRCGWYRTMPDMGWDRAKLAESFRSHWRHCHPHLGVIGSFNALTAEERHFLAFAARDEAARFEGLPPERGMTEKRWALAKRWREIAAAIEGEA